MVPGFHAALMLGAGRVTKDSVIDLEVSKEAIQPTILIHGTITKKRYHQLNEPLPVK